MTTRSPFRTLVLCALALLACALLAGTGRASTVVMLDDRDLAHAARAIVTGRVTAIATAPDGDGVFTYVTVDVARVLKGEATGGPVVLKQLGGRYGGASVRIYGAPEFAVGDELLLYLNTDRDGALHVAHLAQGMFVIATDPSTGRHTVRRPSGAAELPGSRAGKRVTDLAELDAYVAALEAILAEPPSEGARQAYESQAPLREAPAELASTAQTKWTLLFSRDGRLFRWFEPDRGRPIRYLVNPTDSPISAGPTEQIRQALAVWTDVPASSIVLENGGTTSACGLVGDGVSSISFGDCHDQMDDPVNCAGVLAIGGVTRAADEEVISLDRGRDFTRILEADVAFNRKFGCFLGHPANLAEVTAHELGHTIGLGHSSEDASEGEARLRKALMYFRAKGNNHGPKLEGDDVAGVTYVYSRAPRIVSASLPTATAGYPYSARLEAIGGEPPYVFGGGVAVGLEVSPDGLISGTPQSNSVGEITLTVADTRGDTSSRAYIFRVQPHDPVFGFGQSLIAVEARAPFEQALPVYGGLAPYRFSLAAGPLPPGLTLSQEGVLRGMVTELGTWPVVFRVTDASGSRGDAEMYVEVRPGVPHLVNRFLPPAKVGVPYRYQLEAVGGVGPYRIQSDPAGLPRGITCTPEGLISGRPSAPGDNSFNVWMTTAEGAENGTWTILTVNPDRTVPQIHSVTVSPDRKTVQIRATLPPGKLSVRVNMAELSARQLDLKVDRERGILTLKGSVGQFLYAGRNAFDVMVRKTRSEYFFVDLEECGGCRL